MGTDIFEKLDVHLQHHRMGTWPGTFRDYLGMVIKQPSLAQRARARLYNMIKRTGVQVDDEAKEHYAFFEHDLFGIDEPLARVVEYFKAAAMGSDVGRRVLLLYGPPSSGKSQLVIRLCRKSPKTGKLRLASHWFSDSRFLDSASKSQLCDRALNSLDEWHVDLLAVAL